MCNIKEKANGVDIELLNKHLFNSILLLTFSFFKILIFMRYFILKKTINEEKYYEKKLGVGIVAFIDMLYIISILMLAISSLMFEKTLYIILTVIPAFCFGFVAYDVKRGSEKFKGKDLFINTDELKFTLLYDIKKDSSLISYYHVCRMRLKFIIDVVFILLMIPYTLFYFILNDYIIIALIILCVISFVSLIIWLSLPKIFPKFAVKKAPRYKNMDYKDCLK